MIERFEIREDYIGKYIIQIESLKLKDGTTVEQGYRLNLGESGVFTWGNDAEELCSLLNDGLAFRQIKKGEQDVSL